MVSLAVICEGKTERLFAEQLLASHLSNFGVAVSAIEVGVDCKQSGGNVTFERIVHDAELLLQSHDTVTTMVDFFRLGTGWSGLQRITPKMSSGEQADAVEASARNDAESLIKIQGVGKRFMPNVLMHEFEGILFTDPDAIVSITHARAALDSLKKVAAKFTSPEDINSGAATAPSKRLQALGANYGKIAHGARIAARIGLAAMRSACPHFNAWLDKLEHLGK